MRPRLKPVSRPLQGRTFLVLILVLFSVLLSTQASSQAAPVRVELSAIEFWDSTPPGAGIPVQVIAQVLRYGRP